MEHRLWLVRTENLRGQWCVSDLRRGYRICAYHAEAHGGVHLHTWGAKTTLPVDIPGPSEAERIMRAYARGHEGFELAAFRKEVARWRSASRSG